jgi:predicted metal-dependent phosphoesterase TrpH
LSPQQLVQRAHAQGVTVLALTDHDTTHGLSEAQQAADLFGMRLIKGIELSATYLHECLHIVGLNIDPLQPDLQAGIYKQQQLRTERANTIAKKLEKKNIFGAFEAVVQVAGNGEITRLHFADFLVAKGYVSSQQEAFDRYLSAGKPAYVPTMWADLAEVVHWIKLAGGVAVLAHPLRYKLSAKWMRRALTAFKEMGGEGIEVVTGRAGSEEIRVSSAYAQQLSLCASVGSDFHAPDNQWLELGRLAELPKQLRPVWELF